MTIKQVPWQAGRKEEASLYFRQLLHEERSCVSYLVGCPSHAVCAVVDPQGDPRSYIDRAGRDGLTITHVIDTHIHADHESSARALSEAAGATLLLGEGADVGFSFEALTEGEVVRVGNREIRIFHTPGHTPEHVTLFVDDWFLITGDTLFVGDVGRVDLALEGMGDVERDRRARELHASLRRLLTLPDYVEVFPGHYAGSTCGRGMDGKASSTLGRERRSNRALMLDAEGFVDFQRTNTPPMPDEFLHIKKTNTGQVGAAPSSDPKEVVAER